LIDYPVVDVHAHTFNAHYLPIDNIIRARHAENAKLSRVRVSLLLGIGRIIAKRTRLTPFGAEPDFVDVPLERLENQAAARGESLTPVTAVAEGSESSEARLTADLAEAEPQLPAPVGPAEQVASSKLELFTQAIMPDEPKVQQRSTYAKRRAASAAVARFLSFLTKSELRNARELSRDEFDGRVRLFVNHMMDLGPVFGQRPDGRRFIDFPTEQIRRARQLDRAMAGRFVHFVAWNPYRLPNDPALATPEPLRIVQEAIRRGAWGIKFYPPSGYRPANNDVPERPPAGVRREQWDARYRVTSDASRAAANARLDALNDRLFAWAVAKGIPIFAHSAGGEFSASEGYGQRNADPEFWEPVLERYPKLRLCFAHAGGGTFWFERSFTGGGWGRAAYELCTKFENVYCEFGANDDILEPNRREAFTRRITDLAGKPDQTRAYAFADKIMYGSDWFMPTTASPRTRYLDSYREAFLANDAIRQVYKKFFCQNAIRFLRLEDQVARNANLTPAMRTELRKLIADSGR
jgi:predicted TIM-barrel fold metal-dependent hydrolase